MICLRIIVVGFICCAFFVNPGGLFAQGYEAGPIQIQGSAGFSSELYGVRGIDARRPAGSGRIFARVTAEGLGFRYGIDLNLSTEQSVFRQNLNQVGLNFSYEWIRFAAGDVRPVYSPFSLNGVNVRGASIEATPGNWLVSFAGGRSQRAIKPTEERPFLSPVFDQWLYAGKAGYISSSSDYIHFIGTYAQDAVSSLTSDLRSQFDLIPAENSTLTADLGKSLFENRLSVDGTFTWSAHSGDSRRLPDERRSLPVVFSLFMDERSGTFSDYAGRLNIRYNETSFNINTSYERVQPGFVSLGLPYIRNDQEHIRIRPQFFLKDRRVRIGLDYGQTRNNLAGHLLNTNYRNQAGINTQTRFSEQFSVSADYRFLLNRTMPRNDDSGFDMRQITHNISLSPSYNWKHGDVSHNVLITANMQLFDMDRRGQDGAVNSDFTNLSTSFNYDVTLASGLSLSPGATWLISRSDQSDLDTWRTQMSVSHDFYDRLITIAITTSYTHNTMSFTGELERPDMVSEQFSINLNAGYRLPIGDYLRLNIRGLHNSRSSQSSFSELQATLQLNHRF